MVKEERRGTEAGTQYCVDITDLERLWHDGVGEGGSDCNEMCLRNRPALPTSRNRRQMARTESVSGPIKL